MNQTFEVASLVDCGDLKERWVYRADSVWRQNLVGCRVLQILQDMYGFRMTYAYKDILYNSSEGLSSFSNSVDVYARPIALTREFLDDAYPILPIFTWRYGFILRRATRNMFQSLYSLPFTRSAWNCLYAMAIVVSLIFYLLNWWERHRMGGIEECSIGYELLVIIGAYCQHSLPVRPVSQSRRIGYITFFLFAYVIYTYYCSNLLSHMVTDREGVMSLENLMNSDYNFVLMDNTKTMFTVKGLSCRNRTLVQSKLSQVKVVNVSQALEAVRTTKTAVLCDYETIYQDIMSEFDNKEICQLIEVDVFSSIRKYFFTSRNFAYKEQFKVGILRAKESGILQRLVSLDYSRAHAPRCAPAPHRPRATLAHILNPLIVLGATYMCAVLVLLVERAHYNRNRVFPYVD